MNQPATLILGGGIAGLACADRARQRDEIWPIYEAAATPGGLLDSFQLETEAGSWTFDNGVHLSFAAEPEVRAVFDRTKFVNHDAKSLNWDNGHWLPHPVQNNMFALPAAEKTELIADLAEHIASAPAEPAIATYRDWLLHQYGPKIAERWPLRYTKKYWTIDAAELGTAWIGNRMRRADLREVLFGAMSADTPNTYYISTMRYPVSGGYRSFITPLIDGATIYPSHRAISIDNRARTVTFDNGATIAFDRLVCTIPLPALISLMTEVPDEIRALAGTLFASAVDLISLGFSRPSVSPSLWFYIYDTDIMAARVYAPSWKSPHNAPPGHSSVQFEIYSSPARPQTASVAEMTENCIMALERLGLASRSDIVLRHHKHLPYGNVIFDLGMEARRDRVRDWVATQNIQLAGRFGTWDYLWSNQAFMSGLSAADALLGPGGSVAR